MLANAIALVVTLLPVAAAHSATPNPQSATPNPQSATPNPQSATPNPQSAVAGPIVVVETSKGTFEFETYPDDAPKTVAHVLALVRSGFYDGQRIHRALA